ncbi:MAG: hypothetical protein JXQ79_03660 [Rhodobacteraceae bacterium]|nr:hypothetical protein [Paracoccaceae bacterium]
MNGTVRSLVPRLGTVCRAGAVALIAGVYRSRSFAEINDKIAARPVAEQAAIVLAALMAMFILSLIAAQFGWVGMLALWLAVIIVVN